MLLVWLLPIVGFPWHIQLNSSSTNKIKGESGIKTDVALSFLV